MTTAKRLRCGHLFHVQCLRSWLERQHTCPTCRAPVAPPENGTSTTGSWADAHQQGNHMILFLVMSSSWYILIVISSSFYWICETWIWPLDGDTCGRYQMILHLLLAELSMSSDGAIIFCDIKSFSFWKLCKKIYSIKMICKLGWSSSPYNNLIYPLVVSFNSLARLGIVAPCLITLSAWAILEVKSSDGFVIHWRVLLHPCCKHWPTLLAVHRNSNTKYTFSEFKWRWWGKWHC